MSVESDRLRPMPPTEEDLQVHAPVAKEAVETGLSWVAMRQPGLRLYSL